MVILLKLHATLKQGLGNIQQNGNIVALVDTKGFFNIVGIRIWSRLVVAKSVRAEISELLFWTGIFKSWLNPDATFRLLVVL